jgi:stage II sporulation protein D
MAYISEEEAADRWGEENAGVIYETIRAAVKATEGEYLSYEGLPIAALFHSCSVGKTENASQVWGREYPYLISVSSGEEARITQVKVPLARLNEILQSQGDPDFSSALWNDSNQISLSFTNTGRVSTLALNGYCMKATLLRIALGLRSTDFTVEIQGNEAVFTVRGSGHGVGMSQYGAEAMAKSGADYREILLHYYSGVRIENVGKA